MKPKEFLTQATLSKKLELYLAPAEAEEVSKIIFRLKDYLLPDNTPHLQLNFREYFFEHPEKAVKFLELVKNEKDNPELCFLMEKFNRYYPYGSLELSYIGKERTPVVKLYYNEI